jgi:putative ABC transport system substrate-binding protein
MKKLLAISLFLLLSPGLSEAGSHIVAVQSIRVKPYEETIKGFRSVCNATIKRIVISELGGADVVREINAMRPAVVLAIGRDALSMVKRIETTPIVYVMVLNPQSALGGEENITGVSMNIPLEKQLKALLGALPYARNIGLLYDPNRTGPLANEAQDAARRIGITLVAKEIHDARDAPSLIMDMRQKIDVFWMLPDITVITPQTVEFLLLFSQENDIPLFAFAEKYVEAGALISTGIDAFDMGSQAGVLANQILSGKSVRNVRQVHARRVIVSTNLMVARKLGIKVNIAMNSAAHGSEKIIREAQMVN